MTQQSRNHLLLVFLALGITLLAAGCTSHGGSASSADPGFSSGFAEVMGTYRGVDNPAEYITLSRDGSAEISTARGKVSTSIYMETGVLRLADGTRIGDYPLHDGTLIYQGAVFRK